MLSLSPMSSQLHLITGNDTPAVREAARALVDERFPAEEAAFRVEVIDASGERVLWGELLWPVWG